MMGDELLAAILDACPDEAPEFRELFFEAIARERGPGSRRELLKAGGDVFLESLQAHAHSSFGAKLDGLVGAPVYLVPTRHCAAQTWIHDGRPVILVSQGLLGFFSFLAEGGVIISIQRKLCSRTDLALGKNAPEARSTRLIADKFTEWFNGLCLLYQSDPRQLPGMRATLPDWYLAQVADITSNAELFVLLHESAHVRLDHLAQLDLRSGAPDTLPGFTGRYLSLRPRNGFQRQEMEADLLACRSLGEKAVSSLLLGAATFLLAQGSYEIAFGVDSDTHPSAIARLTKLLEELESEVTPEAASVARATLTGLKESFARFGMRGLLVDAAADSAGAHPVRNVFTTATQLKIVKELFDGRPPHDAVTAMVAYSGQLGHMLSSFGRPLD